MTRPLLALLVITAAATMITGTHGQHIDRYCTTGDMGHKIINIKSSVALGAKLLQGKLEASRIACVQSCCEEENCDLAVYNAIGTSRSNHNCYLVWCGHRDNCVFVDHAQFSAVHVIKTDSQSTVDDNNDDANHNNLPLPDHPTKGDAKVPIADHTTTDAAEDGTSSTGVIKPTTTLANTPAPTITTTTATQKPQATSSKIAHGPSKAADASVPVSTSSVAAAIDPVSTATTGTHSVMAPIPSPSTLITSSTDTAGTKPPSSVDGSDGSDGGFIIEAVPSVSTVENELNESEKGAHPSKRCGNGSCSATKVAGLVVSCTILAALLVIIVAVVAKRSWNRHYNRKYRNVDYLIDGMYS